MNLPYMYTVETVAIVYLSDTNLSQYGDSCRNIDTSGMLLLLSTVQFQYLRSM